MQNLVSKSQSIMSIYCFVFNSDEDAGLDRIIGFKNIFIIMPKNVHSTHWTWGCVYF